ncbi:hypothetical protein CIK05_12810 [Bdellovibrio sp. qaytius]|nr:hypothetical protein CIK05_12810 [Bdellovibrio sp. qaytius]
MKKTKRGYMKQNTHSRIGAAFLLALALLAGCTKKVAYDYENHDEVHAKSEIDQTAEYLYVPSTANSTRTAEVARPYWQGDEKLVKFQFTEKTLQVIEVDRETRFSGNSTNNKLVMEIPVEHIQYKCSEDKYGDCTQSETKDSDLKWSSRSAFKPAFDSTRVIETNTLPIELENLFTGNCYRESSSKFLGYEMKDDKINFQIERTFTAGAECLTQINKLSDLTLSQVYHYSFVKLKSIATADFKPISYPTTDDGIFGFFPTENIKLDVDNNSSEKDKEVLMNHWNPNRKVVDYYLDANYSKPENEAVRAATYLAFDRINEGLAEAQVGFRLKLHDNSGQVPGDISNSMIVLVEDPSASSILGYGPTATNPLTGEILSGRVIMYKGILETYIKYTYDDLRRSKLAEKAAAKKVPFIAGKGVFLQPVANQPAAQKNSKVVKNLAAAKAKLATGKGSNFIVKDLNMIQKSLKNYTQYSNVKSNDAIYAASRHCLYMPEALGVDSKLSSGIAEIVGNDLRPWEELSSSEKKRILDTIIPATFVSVLVHELGHNLGLRHNFSGSEDKANFYNKEELAAHHMDHESPYSSAMEYGSNELDNLVALGKYDVAALRFGYNREVENASGTIVKLDSTLEAKLAEKTDDKLVLKEYKYCTDEHVGANAGCKRFDAGTSYVEIANQLIDSYEERYFLRNFRNGRLSFSMVGDLNYAGSIDYTFDNLRTFFEVRERIKSQFELADDAAEWESVPFLKDLNDATKISARFFMKVLKMPDMTCAIAKATAPNQIIAVETLAKLNPDAATCYEVSLNPAYVVVGTYGKSFQSKKSLNSTNAYLDQIDVRGIWPDKVLAARYLFARKLGSYSFDKVTDNYTDISELEGEIADMSLGLVLNQTVADVEIKDKNGLTLLSGAVPVDTLRSNIIPEAIVPQIAKALGVPEKESLFVQTYMKTIATQMQSTMASVNSGRAFADLFKVHTANVMNPINAATTDETLNTTIGDQKYIANPENQVAHYLISRLKVQEAVSALGLTDAQITEITGKRAKGEKKPEGTLTAAENYLWDTDMTELNQTLSENTADLVDVLNVVPAY